MGNYKHLDRRDGKKTRLYRSWQGMKDRCLNPNSKKKEDYHDRGITICSEWKYNYATFKEWALLNGYSENLTLDRIDNDGNYEPDNCRWTDSQTQVLNRRTIFKSNTSGYVGVSFNKANQAYSSAIKVNRKTIFLGNYKDPIDAAIARDLYIRENSLRHNLNFPNE